MTDVTGGRLEFASQLPSERSTNPRAEHPGLRFYCGTNRTRCRQFICKVKDSAPCIRSHVIRTGALTRRHATTRCAAAKTTNNGDALFQSHPEVGIMLGIYRLGVTGTEFLQASSPLASLAQSSCRRRLAMQLRPGADGRRRLSSAVRSRS